jgi:hypothetical protein
MDNPTTLLVAIMYVTIVATGLVSVLMALSDILGGQRKLNILHSGWIFMLLINYLSFFWETTAILEFEGWNFLSFVGFVSGPVILLFATNLLITPPGPAQGTALKEYYFDQSPRFFIFLALVQAWIIALDVFTGNFNFQSYVTIGVGALFLVLSISKSYRLHLVTLILVGVIFLSRLILQAMDSL